MKSHALRPVRNFILLIMALMFATACQTKSSEERRLQTHKKIYQERWDAQYYAKIIIAQSFLYKDHTVEQGNIEDKAFIEIDKQIEDKYNLTNDSIGVIISEGHKNFWTTANSFNRNWQVINSFPEINVNTGGRRFAENALKILGYNTNIEIKAAKAKVPKNTPSQKQTTPVLTAEEKRVNYLKSIQSDFELFKKECKTIPYKKLKRDAEMMRFETIRMKGTVLQVSRNYGGFMIRVEPLPYSQALDQVVLTSIVPLEEVDVYENDNITIYGYVHGVKTYTSQAGWRITAPKIEVV